MKKITISVLALILTFGLVVAGCDNGTTGNGNGNGNGNQSAYVEATFTVEQFVNAGLDYRFNWQSVPGAVYYNIYTLSNGKPVLDEGYINKTTFAKHESNITFSNTEGQYYWVTAALSGGGETKPPENKIIKFSWNLYTTTPWVLQWKKVEYVPYSTLPITQYKEEINLTE